MYQMYLPTKIESSGMPIF